MFITLFEVFDMALMIAVIGFIFKDFVRQHISQHARHSDQHDILNRYMKKSSVFDWHSFWFAAMVTAPAILLHEMGHKITALSFGLTATFHAAYTWLAIGVVLKLINFPFIFFVPAFVSIGEGASALQSTLIAFAGPFVNLLLFTTAFIVLKSGKMKGNAINYWGLTKNINLFLFIFNMIPIPGFDGFTVFSGLAQVLGILH